MKSKTRWWFVLLAVVAIGVVIVWQPFTPTPAITRENAERIQIGMTRNRVERMLGSAGPNYSSIFEIDYFIWKGPEIWIRVYFKDGKVTEMDWVPKPLMDDGK